MHTATSTRVRVRVLLAGLAIFGIALTVVSPASADSGTVRVTKNIIGNANATADLTVNWSSKNCSGGFSPYYRISSWSAYFERSYAYRAAGMKFSTVVGQVNGFECGAGNQLDPGRRSEHNNVAVGWVNLLQSKTYTYSPPTSWPWMSADTVDQESAMNVQLAVKVTDGGSTWRGCLIGNIPNFFSPSSCSVSPS